MTWTLLPRLVTLAVVAVLALTVSSCADNSAGSRDRAFDDDADNRGADGSDSGQADRDRSVPDTGGARDDGAGEDVEGWDDDAAQDGGTPGQDAWQENGDALDGPPTDASAHDSTDPVEDPSGPDAGVPDADAARLDVAELDVSDGDLPQADVPNEDAPQDVAQEDVPEQDAVDDDVAEADGSNEDASDADASDAVVMDDTSEPDVPDDAPQDAEPVPDDLDLRSQIAVWTLPAPVRLAAGPLTWHTWEQLGLSPRLYHTPLSNHRFFIGMTGEDGAGYVSFTQSAERVRDFRFPDRSVEGLVGREDEGFTVLLRGVDTGVDDPAYRLTMWLERYDADGVLQWSRNLNLQGTIPERLYGQTTLGDARLSFNGDRYAAYYTVYDVRSNHFGDQLRFVGDDGQIRPGGWPWGCSHSMAQILGSRPGGRFLALCSSDTFPEKGIRAWRANEVYLGGGNGGGLVSAQLGQAAATPDGWLVAFNSVLSPGGHPGGLGLRELDIDGVPVADVMWMEGVDGQAQRDPVLAQIGTADDPERYLYGWRDTGRPAQFWLMIVDRGGQRLGPEKQDVFRVPDEPAVFWGRRDDSFRTTPEGNVSWVSHIDGRRGIQVYEFLKPW